MRVHNMMCMHAPIMAGRFGTNKVSNGSVTSDVISWVTSKKETKSASHLGHKMSKKSKKCVWTVSSRKNRKKNNKSTHTHPT